MRILVVEDEPKIGQFVLNVLKEMGHTADLCHYGKVAQEYFSQVHYDLVVLDLMLPDVSGLDLCKIFKHSAPEIPVMILTTLSQTADKVKGLDAGADDYLSKPFEVEEFSARVRALLRRNKEAVVDLTCGDLRLDLLKRVAWRQGTEIRLTVKEFSLLEYFIRNLDRPLTRTQIAQHVWDLNFDSESNVIDAYVKQLRKKIDQPFETKLIKTLVGYGYKISYEK